MKLFGEFLLDDETVDYSKLIKILNKAIVKPFYKISVLNPDETIQYEIPSEDIPQDGISYTEDYQNGCRRSLSLKLINKNGKYTPSINGIWLTTKFRLDIGIKIKNNIVWFPKGIYIMGDVNLVNSSTERIITIQLKDKFAIFEGKMGTLENVYEVQIGSTVWDVLNGIRNFSLGNGYIYDYKELYIDPSLVNFKTQTTIRVEEGGNLGDIVKELATQMSAEYYYNSVGNLSFYPINDTMDDSNKPIIWTFSTNKGDLWDFQLNYKNEEVVNVIKVVGDNIENGISSYVATNENPMSPICIQQIGRRAAPKRSEPNVWNDQLAHDLARYYLRQASFVSVEFSCQSNFNPLLTVNNICEIEDSYLSAKREKLLITSISFSSSDNKISLHMCNTKELPFNQGVF